MDSNQALNVKKTRISKKMLVCNIIISLLCLVSMVSYFLLPLQKTTFTLYLNKTVLAEEFHDEFDEYFEGSNISIALPISITTAEMTKLALKPKQALAHLIADSINNTIEESYSDVFNLILLHMEHELKADFIERINNKIIFSYDDAPLTETELEAIRLKVEIDNAYVENVAEELMDAAFEDISKTELTDLARKKFITAYRNMAKSDDPNLQDVTFTEANEESVQNYVEIFYLSEFATESVLSQFSTKEKAKATVTSLVGDEGDIENGLTGIFNGTGGMLISIAVSIIPIMLLLLLLLSLFFWGILLLKTIKRFFSPNSEIKIKGVIISSIPIPLFIGVAPIAVVSLLRKSIISNLFNGIIGVLSSASSSFSIKFGTSAWIPLILSLVLAVFTFFAFGHKRKQEEFNSLTTDYDLDEIPESIDEALSNAKKGNYIEDDLSTDDLLEEIYNDDE